VLLPDSVFGLLAPVGVLQGVHVQLELLVLRIAFVGRKLQTLVRSFLFRRSEVAWVQVVLSIGVVVDMLLGVPFMALVAGLLGCV
jgi:hypothetical protein